MPIHRAGPCSITCPNGGGCIYWRDTEECDCFCNDDQSRFKRKTPVTLDTKVDFFAQELKLSELASRLNEVLPHEISAPENPSRKMVDIELKNVSILEVIQAVGLLRLHIANYSEE
jgi:hypothetical protein